MENQLKACNKAFADVYVQKANDRKSKELNEAILVDSLLILGGICSISVAIAFVTFSIPASIPLVCAIATADLVGSTALGLGLAKLTPDIHSKTAIENPVDAEANKANALKILENTKDFLTLADAFSKTISARRKPEIYK